VVTGCPHFGTNADLWGKRLRLARATLAGSFTLMLLGGYCWAPGLVERAAASSLAPPPDFDGTASRLIPSSDCPRVLPSGLAAPFGPSTQSLTAASYQIQGCWAGMLAGAPFTIDLYFSAYGGGGVAVRYGGQLVARVLAGTGPPVVVRFTGESVCWMEQAGTFYGAVDIKTGVVLPDKEAQFVCPPPPGSPPRVLGLQGVRSPLPVTPSALPAASFAAQTPRALPRTGGGGAAAIPHL